LPYNLSPSPSLRYLSLSLLPVAGAPFPGHISVKNLTQTLFLHSIIQLNHSLYVTELRPRRKEKREPSSEMHWKLCWESHRDHNITTTFSQRVWNLTPLLISLMNPHLTLSLSLSFTIHSFHSSSLLCKNKSHVVFQNPFNLPLPLPLFLV
jgi:hypothetical protein